MTSPRLIIVTTVHLLVFSRLVPLTLTYSVAVFLRSSCSYSGQVNNATVQRALADSDLGDLASTVTIIDACEAVTAGRQLLTASTDAIIGPGDHSLCGLFWYMVAVQQQREAQGGIGTVFVSTDCLQDEQDDNTNGNNIIWMQPSVDDTAIAVATVLFTYRWHSVAIAYTDATFYRNVASQLFIMLTSAFHDVAFISKLSSPSDPDDDTSMASFISEYASQIKSVKGENNYC